MFLPAADLLDELRVDLLEGLGLLEQLLPKPLDGRRLVGDEELELQDLADGHALLVVLGDLVGEEVHPITLRETLLQPGVELRCGQRHGHAALDVEGHHAVEEQVVLPLGDDLGLAVLGDEDRKLLQVGADEIPDAIFCSSVQSLKRSSSPPLGL